MMFDQNGAARGDQLPVVLTVTVIDAVTEKQSDNSFFQWPRLFRRREKGADTLFRYQHPVADQLLQFARHRAARHPELRREFPRRRQLTALPAAPRLQIVDVMLDQQPPARTLVSVRFFESLLIHRVSRKNMIPV